MRSGVIVSEAYSFHRCAVSTVRFLLVCSSGSSDEQQLSCLFQRSRLLSTRNGMNPVGSAHGGALKGPAHAVTFQEIQHNSAVFPIEFPTKSNRVERLVETGRCTMEEVARLASGTRVSRLSPLACVAHFTRV